jgi:hypothetical protein
MASDDRTRPAVLRYETPEPKSQQSWRWLLWLLLAVAIPWAIMLAVKFGMKLWFAR